MKSTSLRAVAVWLFLPLLLLTVIWQLNNIYGWSTRWVRYRVQQLAQYGATEWDNHCYGIPMQQYPTDLMIYQQLIWDFKPDVFIETGTYYGGNAFYVATLLEAVNPRAQVLTVDIDAANWKKTLAELQLEGKDRLLQRIHFFEGSSTDPAVLARMKEHIPKDARVMVLLDSDHSRAHVLNELKLYAPLVSLNGYLIVNDTQWGDPLRALEDFLPTTDAFVVDAKVDRFYLSCAHGGFLKRVR